MPIYSYRCATCKRAFEELFSIKERPDAINCKNKKCGSVARFEMSAGHFEVKGANARNRYAGDSNLRWFDTDGKEEK